MLPKLSSACCAMRSIKPLVSHQILHVVYYFHFHTLISYVLMCAITQYIVTEILKCRKILRILTGSRSRDSCRKLFGHLLVNILPLPSLYIFSNLLFFMKYRGLFDTNNEKNEHDT